MKSLTSLMLGGALVAMFAANAPAQTPKDNPKCEPNPVFNRFTGEVVGGCERARFRELELYQWKTPNDPKSGASVLKVEGEYWYYFNDIARDAKGLFPGKLEVRRNFENAVREAKGDVLSVDSSAVYYRIRKGWSRWRSGSRPMPPPRCSSSATPTCRARSNATESCRATARRR